MAYIKPSVLVYQQFISQSPVIVAPDLDTLIIGPNYLVLDKEAVSGVVYDPAQGNTFTYPSLETGAVVDLASNMDIYFKDVVATIVPTSANGSVVKDGNVLTDVGETFVTKGVNTEDIIKLVNPSTGLVETYYVDAVLTETTLKVFGKFEYSTNEVTGIIAETFNIVVSTNDALLVKVDGGSSQPVTLTPNATATAADIATDINGAITGATASATTDGKVNIVSDTAGGSVEIETVANDAYSDLGFTVGLSLASYRVVNDRKDYTDVKIRNPIDNVDPNTDFAADDTGIILDPGIQVYATGGQSYPVESVGSITITYRALRVVNTAEILDVESLDEIQGKLGIIDIRNPLALGADIALQNTTTRIRTFSIDEDNVQGYQEVLDRIQDTDEVYSIVCLTQDTTVASSVRSHVGSMSMPKEGKWRVTYWSPKIIKEKDVQQLSGTGDFRYDLTSDTLTIEDTTNGTFISSNIVVGDYMRILDDDTFGNPQTYAGVYKVIEIISEQKLKFENMKYTGAAGEGEYTAGAAFTADHLDISIDYEVFRILDKTGQADSMALLASSYQDRRVRQVLSDRVEITLSDGDHVVPGYYLCAAIAGMRAGLPPHQGFTNFGIAGIKKLYNSNKYFNDTQMNKMAEYGVWIVVQDIEGALPYTRHQITTDVTTLESREDSIVADVDYISYFFKRGLKRLLGVYNITPATLALVTTISNAILVYLMEQTLPRIGAPLLAGSEVVSVGQHDTFLDQINVAVDLKVPYPVNKIRVDLLV